MIALFSSMNVGLCTWIKRNSNFYSNFDWMNVVIESYGNFSQFSPFFEFEIDSIFHFSWMQIILHPKIIIDGYLSTHFSYFKMSLKPIHSNPNIFSPNDHSLPPKQQMFVFFSRLRECNQMDNQSLCQKMWALIWHLVNEVLSSIEIIY